MKMEYITKIKEYPDGSVVKTHSPVLTDKEREIAFSILNSAVRSYAREMFKANSNTNVVAQVKKYEQNRKTKKTYEYEL